MVVLMFSLTLTFLCPQAVHFKKVIQTRFYCYSTYCRRAVCYCVPIFTKKKRIKFLYCNFWLEFYLLSSFILLSSSFFIIATNWKIVFYLIFSSTLCYFLYNIMVLWYIYCVNFEMGSMLILNIIWFEDLATLLNCMGHSILRMFCVFCKR